MLRQLNLVITLILLWCGSVVAKSSEELIHEKLNRVHLDNFQKLISMYIRPPKTDYKKPEEKIDYFNSKYWHRFGDENSIAKYIPNDLKQLELKEKKVAVFYLHPSIYWGTERWNTKLEDESNRIIEELLLVNQASIFSACCKIYVPKRRSAHTYSSIDRSGNGESAILLDYHDSKAAFEAFLEINKDNPFILAGHSGGSAMLALLINEFQEKEAFDNLVAAYLLGWNIRNDHFKSLSGCQHIMQIKCFLGWNTTMNNSTPIWKGEKNLYCSNPISAKQGNEKIPLSRSLGSMSFSDYASSDIRDENKRQLKNLEGFVQCKGGHLIIEGADLTQFTARFFNLHSYDYGLFYGDIMRDSLTRARSFFNQTKK